MKTQKAIVVDDQKIISDSFRELLKQTGKFKTVNNFYAVTEAKKELLQNEYDYLFTDFMMPNTDVREFICFVRQNYPQTKIVVISSLTDTVLTKEIFGLGASAYISKYSGKSEIVTAIERTESGERYISADMANRIATEVVATDTSGITKREIEILRFVAKGASISETAQLMNLSPHTVVSHRKNIMQKLGLHSATEMAKYAYENKIC